MYGDGTHLVQADIDVACMDIVCVQAKGPGIRRLGVSWGELVVGGTVLYSPTWGLESL